MERLRRMPPWQVALWSVFITFILLYLMSIIIVIAVDGLTCDVFWLITKKFGPVFAIIAAFVGLLSFLIIQFPLQTIIGSLLLVFVALMLGSMKEHVWSEYIRSYIEKEFVLEYFVAAITVAALLLTLIAIIRRR